VDHTHVEFCHIPEIEVTIKELSQLSRCASPSTQCSTSTLAALSGIEGTNHLKSSVAANAPASWAATNPPTSAGLIPAKVFVMDRATVTAGFANEVEAVNQYAAMM
jgi:hypothetical protein